MKHPKVKTFHLQSGQSLFEATLAIGVIAVLIVAFVSLSTRGIKNSLSAKNKNLALKYSQETLEWLRSERDQDWNAFSTHAQTPLWCLPNLSWPGSGGSCGSGQLIPQTNFKRELAFPNPSANSIFVEVKISWPEAGATKTEKTSTIFTHWKSGVAPTP